MPRANGCKLTDGARRRAVRGLQSMVAAGVSDDEAREEVAQRFNVSVRTTSSWLQIAYREMAREADVDRKQLVGTALRRRRLAMARSAKAGDWRTYLQAAESEAKLLGLNAPIQSEHLVLVEQARGLSGAVVDVVKDFFQDDPEQRARFVDALRRRLSAQVADRREKMPIVIDAESEEVAQLGGGEASDARLAAESADVAPRDVAAPVELAATKSVATPVAPTSRVTEEPALAPIEPSARV